MDFSFAATATSEYPEAIRPTMYFVGVTTEKSSIRRIFPRWAQELGLGDVELRGVDCRLHDEPAVYRRVVEHIKHDDLVKGALVTTHKIDLLNACRDMFDWLDPHATLMGEVSCICKRDGQLKGQAVDAVTSGVALEAFLPDNYWLDNPAHALILGAGGSSIALSSYLIDPKRGVNRPSQVIVANRSQPRLDALRAIHANIDASAAVQYRQTPDPQDSDTVMAALPDHSLVANATGLGKDAPGSPITDAAVFPQCGYAWDFNYRGDLRFITQAHGQQSRRQLHVEDGWVYFIHGWVRVIAEVFDVAIPTSGPIFVKLAQIANSVRGHK